MRGQCQTMLDGQRRDLDVGNVVTAQAWRAGEFLGQDRVSSTMRHEGDSRLPNIRLHDRPPSRP